MAESALDRDVDLQGKPVPLGRALAALAKQGRDAAVDFFHAQPLSLLERLQVLAALGRGDAYQIAFDLTDSIDWPAAEAYTGEAAVTAWAVAEADANAALFRPEKRISAWGGAYKPREPLRVALVRALLAGKVPLQPAWDRLLPLASQPNLALSRSALQAIPEALRGEAALRGLEHEHPAQVVWAVQRLIDLAPSGALATLAVDSVQYAIGIGKRELVASLLSRSGSSLDVAAAIAPSKLKALQKAAAGPKPAKAPKKK